MGCGCNKQEKLENKVEVTNENILNIEYIQNDENKLKSIIKIQRFYRNKHSKNNLLKKKQSDSKESSSKNLILEIPKEELTTLMKEYPPLSDNVKVSLNGPIIDKNTKSVYLGEWDYNKNVKHGRGIQYWSEGSKYNGYWVCGKANIKGKLIHYDGDIYEGGWLDDQPNGKGKYIHLDGTTYEGDWKNDKKDGFGSFYWNNGKIYKGNWKNGKKHGEGEVYFPEEKIWKKGLWENGERVKYFEQE